MNAGAGQPAEYRHQRLDVASFDPATVSLALDGDLWIGMAGFTTHVEPGGDGGYLFASMTGVVRPWRRCGLATALKAHNLDLAQRTGLPIMRTVHQPGNTAMIALNRRLGFVDAFFEYP